MKVLLKLPAMSSHPILKVEMPQFTVAEQIQIAQDLWDSILEQQSELPLTDVQQQELNQRPE